MKLKKAIAFLLAWTMMMSLTACSENDDSSDKKKNDTTVSSNTDSDAKDKEDDSNSEDSAPELLKEPLDMANANCAAVYSAAYKYTEKCLSAGFPITETDGDCTGLLIIGESDNPRKAPNKNNETLTQEIIEYLSNTVNYELKENRYSLQGTVYCIFYNDRGKPTEVFWAENETSAIVGKYPSEDTYAYTEGGIESIIENGPEAFGNIPLV